MTSRGVVWYSCDQNVQGDPDSCPFTANKFRPERDSTKKQSKLICVVCILPVNGAISIGKKLDGEVDDDGKPSKYGIFALSFLSSVFLLSYNSIVDTTAVQRFCPGFYCAAVGLPAGCDHLMPCILPPSSRVCMPTCVPFFQRPLRVCCQTARLLLC